MNTSSSATTIPNDGPAPTLDPPGPPPSLPPPSPVLTAPQKRAKEPLFVQTFSLLPEALLAKLPLPFPADPSFAPSPKAQYRSHYQYLGPHALLDEQKLKNMTDFEIALHLVDFSPLEAQLAQAYRPSHKGQVAYHPVSMFLACSLRQQEDKSWQALAKLLAGENGAGWRSLFGFPEGATPSASGLRYFFKTVGRELFAELGPRWIKLLVEGGLLAPHSTYPGDPDTQGLSVTEDGMLHPARNQSACRLATDECYQPTPATLPSTEGTLDPEQAGQVSSEPPAAVKTPVALGRPCRAREKGLEGCDCQGAECQPQCHRASPLDAEARFIHYDGSNHKHGERAGQEGGGGGEEKTKGKDVFGYRSVADQVLDDRFSVAWVALSKLYPANTDERSIFVENLKELVERLGGLTIGEWLDDSAVGYGECLAALWEIGALRMVDIRSDKGDFDFEVCIKRGYDGQGRPLCSHGYRMRANGYDRQRRRTKYICAQVCRREARTEGEGEGTVEPVKDCPYFDLERPLGQVTNVGRTMGDGSIRLAREVPYGSATWKGRYGRRNLSESRNGQIEGMGLKRMRSYGLEQNRREVQMADFVINLRTLGRLVREATSIARG